jgi:prepilin-type N-terminal cleavage/methylation domain-containing protein
MSARPTPAGSRAGFSLVELMVVVIILGLIGGVAVSSWQSLLPNQQLNTAIRALSEVLHGTRSEAISRNRLFEIYYDLDQEAYRVRTPYRLGGGFATSEDDDDERVWTNETDLSEYGVSIQRITIDGVVFDDGVVKVRFDPLGASSYHTIVLRQDLFDREFTIEVLPLTGDIRFHEGLFEREPAEESDFD